MAVCMVASIRAQGQNSFSESLTHHRLQWHSLAHIQLKVKSKFYLLQIDQISQIRVSLRTEVYLTVICHASSSFQPSLLPYGWNLLRSYTFSYFTFHLGDRPLGQSKKIMATMTSFEFLQVPSSVQNIEQNEKPVV